MQERRITFLLLFVLALLGLPTRGFSTDDESCPFHESYHGSEGTGGWTEGWVHQPEEFLLTADYIKGLGLTDAQMVRLAKLRADYVKKYAETNTGIFAYEKDLEFQSHLLDSDSKKTNESLDALGRLYRESWMSKLERLRKIRDVLTEAQRKKFKNDWDAPKTKKGKESEEPDRSH